MTDPISGAHEAGRWGHLHISRLGGKSTAQAIRASFSEWYSRLNPSERAGFRKSELERAFRYGWSTMKAATQQNPAKVIPKTWTTAKVRRNAKGQVQVLIGRKANPTRRRRVAKRKPAKRKAARKTARRR